MTVNRRQFLKQVLVYGSLTVGSSLGSVFLSRQVTSQSETVAPTVVNPAPTGLYAPPRGDVRLIVISDLNSAYGATDYLPQVKRAIALIPDWQPDLVLCGGDMVAGQKKSLTSAQLTAMWQAFDQYIAQPLRQAEIPFGFTIGNHDGSGALNNGSYSFAGDRQAAFNYWQDPAHDPRLNFVDRDQFPFNYSFAQNDIFYLVWDASTAQITSAQLTWVEKSLASDLAQQAKLRLVIGHLPLYPVAQGKSAQPGNYLHDGDRLQTLLEKYRVHTYISGHQHAYYPAYRGDLELLHAGAIGDNPRSLHAGNLSPMRTLTVIDIQHNTADLIYTTYDMDRLTVVDQNTLPSYLDVPNGRLIRRDLRSS